MKIKINDIIFEIPKNRYFIQENIKEQTDFLIRGKNVETIIEPNIFSILLSKKYSPSHSAAFLWKNKGVLLFSFPKIGKTETLIQFLLKDAAFISDDWCFIKKGIVYSFPKKILFSKYNKMKFDLRNFKIEKYVPEAKIDYIFVLEKHNSEIEIESSSKEEFIKKNKALFDFYSLHYLNKYYNDYEKILENNLSQKIKYFKICLPLNSNPKETFNLLDKKIA